MVPSEAFNKTAEEEGVKGHPQGCGCIMAGLGAPRWGGGLGLAIGVGLAASRRRRGGRFAAPLELPDDAVARERGIPLRSKPGRRT